MTEHIYQEALIFSAGTPEPTLEGFRAACSCGAEMPDIAGPIERSEWHVLHVADAIVAEVTA